MRFAKIAILFSIVVILILASSSIYPYSQIKRETSEGITNTLVPVFQHNVSVRPVDGDYAVNVGQLTVNLTDEGKHPKFTFITDAMYQNDSIKIIIWRIIDETNNVTTTATHTIKTLHEKTWSDGSVDRRLVLTLTITSHGEARTIAYSARGSDYVIGISTLIPPPIVPVGDDQYDIVTTIIIYKPSENLCVTLEYIRLSFKPKLSQHYEAISYAVKELLRIYESKAMDRKTADMLLNAYYRISVELSKLAEIVKGELREYDKYIREANALLTLNASITLNPYP